MRLVVGSTSLKYWGVHFRDPKDVDVITDTLLCQDDEIYLPKYVLDRFAHKEGYVIPEHILTLKISHMGWQTHKEQYGVWQKHKQDVIALLNGGYEVDEYLYYLLVNHWESVHGSKEFLSFDKTKRDFFDDHVKYVYDHDYLHTTIKEVPTYTKCLRDGEEVAIDKDKFDLLLWEDKISFFKEEITVIALERWVVHNTCSWYRAYQLALEKTITRLTKNWMTDFILLNLQQFLQPDVELFYNFFKQHGEYEMTDITIFEELYEKYGEGDSLSSFVGNIFTGDLCEAFCDLKLTGKPYQEYANYKAYKDAFNASIEKLDIENLVQEGGGEGGSEYCYGVVRIGDKMYAAEWSYYSHEGYDFYYIVNTIKEVKPVEKTVIVYE